METSGGESGQPAPNSAPASTQVGRGERPRTGGALRILRPLRNRDFGFLWSGMTVSLLGDGIYLVAIAWLVLRISNSPSALGAVGVAWSLPQIVSLLWGGVASDRFDRRMVMIVADITRGVPIGLIGLLSIGGVLELWHVFVLVAFAGVGEGIFMPAFTSVVPDVVPKSQIVEANALDQFVRPLALRFAGPALGGVLLAAAGAGVAFLVDAATFAFSAVMISAMRKVPHSHAAEEVASSTWREVRVGLAYVRRHAWLWITLAVMAIGLLVFYGPFHVLMPYLVKNGLGGNAQDLGFVFAVGGIGAILSALLMSQIGMPKRHITFIYLATALGVLTLVGYAMSESVWHIALASFAMEILLTAGLIVWSSLMQIKVPSRLLGRVSSLDWLVSSSLIPLSYGLAGPVSRSIGIRMTFGLAGLVGAAVILVPLLSRGLRAVEKEPLPLAVGRTA